MYCEIRHRAELIIVDFCYCSDLSRELGEVKKKYGYDYIEMEMVSKNDSFIVA